MLILCIKYDHLVQSSHCCPFVLGNSKTLYELT